MTDTTTNKRLARMLNTELSQLKLECASLSNEMREWVEQFESETRRNCEELVRCTAAAAAERDEAKRMYLAEEKRRRQLLKTILDIKGNIRVVCRIRPTLRGEEDKGSANVAIQRVSREVVAAEGKTFEFDEVFGTNSTQSQVYEEVKPMVESVMEGFHACIFAYGQTGSGKTHTMSGPPNDRGINYRSLETLFQMRDAGIASNSFTSVEFRVSNVEIYNEKVRDLLNNNNNNNTGGAGGEDNVLEIRQDQIRGIHLPTCTKVECRALSDVWEAMARGQRNRAQAHTLMNHESSRSHSVVMVDVDITDTVNGRYLNGRLVLVDLAGSERLSKSGVSGERQKEAQNINKSLSALGDVLHGLSSKSDHVPFRNSKLTYLLQDSMGQDNKVMMVVQVAPTQYNLPESLCTLAFGARTKAIELGRAKTFNGNGASAAHAVQAALAQQQATAAKEEQKERSNVAILLGRKLEASEKALGEARGRIAELEAKARVVVSASSSSTVVDAGRLRELEAKLREAEERARRAESRAAQQHQTTVMAPATPATRPPRKSMGGPSASTATASATTAKSSAMKLRDVSNADGKNQPPRNNLKRRVSFGGEESVTLPSSPRPITAIGGRGEEEEEEEEETEELPLPPPVLLSQPQGALNFEPLEHIPALPNRPRSIAMSSQNINNTNSNSNANPARLAPSRFSSSLPNIPPPPAPSAKKKPRLMIASSFSTSSSASLVAPQLLLPANGSTNVAARMRKPASALGGSSSRVWVRR